MADLAHVEEMVDFVSWMTPLHYKIFEFFEKYDIWISARGLAKNIDYSRDYVSRECTKLADEGLLEKEGRIYSLTDKGRGFLAGEIDVDELEQDE